MSIGLEWEIGAQAVLVDDDEFAGLDVAYISGGDDVERARFGCNHPRIAKLSQAEGAETVRIAGGDEMLFRGKDERKSAADLLKRLGDSIDRRFGLGPGDQMEDDFAVR